MGKLRRTLYELVKGKKAYLKKKKKVAKKKSDTESVYFRGIKRKTPEARLKAAGIDWNTDRPSARLKRKK